MPRRFTILVSLLGLLLAACGHSGHDPNPHEPGPNGEPGKLPNVHARQFRVAKRDYFTAMNEFYSFVRAQGFDKVGFGSCFGDILDDSADDENKHLPCLGVYAVKGSPARAHMTFTVLNKDFDRLDYNDFLTCRIDIHIHEAYQRVLDLRSDFHAEVDARLEALDRKVEMGFGGPSYGMRGR
ncbi:MAG TPA: hypothetical protein VGE08_23665 [Steroidobacter sp.]|uniref:hypothetical protein n=1 Tax=Steroidobacter sp. TaxID=1978227 RepID=UPI002ED90E58